jgi:hypothetical protein
MSTTTADFTIAAPDRPIRAGSLALATITSGAAAAGAVVALAAAFRAEGVHLAAGGVIPLPGFATVTLFAAVVGGLIAAAIRRGKASRRRFVQTTVVLALLSCVVPLLAAPGVAGKLALTSTHIVAAAIIIPLLARRLPN